MQLIASVPGSWLHQYQAADYISTRQLITSVPGSWLHQYQAADYTSTRQLIASVPGSWLHQYQAADYISTRQLITSVPCIWFHQYQAANCISTRHLIASVPGSWLHQYQASDYISTIQLISSVPGIWLHQYKTSVHFQNCEFKLSQWTRPTGVWFASGHEPAECCVCEWSVVTLCRIWLDIYVGVVSTVGWHLRVRDSVIKVDCNYLMFEFFWQEPLWWICMACKDECKPLVCSLYIFRRQILLVYTMHYALCTMHYALCTMHYALCTLHFALCTMHYELCTMHYALYTQLLPYRNVSWTRPLFSHSVRLSSLATQRSRWRR